MSNIATRVVMTFRVACSDLGEHAGTILLGPGDTWQPGCGWCRVHDLETAPGWVARHYEGQRWAERRSVMDRARQRT